MGSGQESIALRSEFSRLGYRGLMVDVQLTLSGIIGIVIILKKYAVPGIGHTCPRHNFRAGSLLDIFLGDIYDEFIVSSGAPVCFMYILVVNFVVSETERMV